MTVDLEGEHIGLTVSTLVSLSLEPPLVGISISRFAALHESSSVALARSGSASSARARRRSRSTSPAVCRRSRSGEGIERRAGTTGAPLLEGALGWIECRLRYEYDVGDHTLFVGEVISVERGPGPCRSYTSDRRTGRCDRRGHLRHGRRPARVGAGLGPGARAADGRARRALARRRAAGHDGHELARVVALHARRARGPAAAGGDLGRGRSAARWAVPGAAAAAAGAREAVERLAARGRSPSRRRRTGR